MPLRVAAAVWFAISLRTFGGPAGQIAVMHREIVEERRWISEKRFLHALSYCTVLPGPEAQQLAVYLGWLLNGTAGGLVAGTLFVLPGFVALMVLSAIYVEWGETTWVTAVFAGLAPAVIAIVSQAVVRIGRRSLRSIGLLLIAVASFVSLFLFNLPFPIVIVSAALCGWSLHRLRPTMLSVEDRDGAELNATVIPDAMLHTEQPSLGRAFRVVAVGSVIWFGPALIAAAALGRSHTVIDQAKFFSGTAVVTFGGAYAVLAYVAQRAVSTYQWLLPGEMVNGLALAETTPGPLIMVVQFVAFLGAYRNPGSLDPWVSAVLGASLTVWATFVPCFMFVFLGAPYIERLRSNHSLTAALSGVSAAVVGVIANLSVYFAVHTLFSRSRSVQNGALEISLPVWSSFNGRAVAVTALAFVLVFWLKQSVLRVLGICALAGAALFALWS